MVEIIISGEAKGALSSQLGLAHYSYRFAEAKFEAALRDSYRIERAAFPYYFPNRDILKREMNLQSEDLVHLAFRSAENLRKIKGVYSIGAFAWEFDVLNTVDWRGQNPFQNQIRMLGAFDEIWATSQYTRTVLQNHGLTSVHVIPAPVTDVWTEDQSYGVEDLEGIDFYAFRFNLALREDIYKPSILPQRLNRIPDKMLDAIEADMLYLFILNPYDLRKNLQHLIGAFESFAKAHPKACLLLKLAVPADAGDPSFHVFWGLRRGMGSIASANSDNIFMTAGYLTDQQMAALQAVSTFYVSPSIAEGQNLPLIEAMMARCVPVSTRNTAMLDYVTADNSVIIQTHRRSGTMLDLAPTQMRQPYEVDIASAYQIYQALMASTRIDQDLRKAMAEHARNDVLALYAPEAIRKLVADRFQAIFAPTKGQIDA